MIPYWDVLPLITFNDGNSLLLHLIFIPLWLTSEFLRTLYKRYWYLYSDLSIECFATFESIHIYLLLIIFIHWSKNLMDTSFAALVSIPIFDLLLLANLPISSIFTSNNVFPLHWVHQRPFSVTRCINCAIHYNYIWRW